jgi:hypothetical protein
LKDLKHVEE